MSTAATATEKPAEEIKPTPESGATASSFIERMTLAKAEKKKEKEAEAAKPKEGDDKPADEKPVKPAAAAPKVEAKAEDDKPAKPAAKKVVPMVIPPEPVDTAAIASAAASAAVAAVAKSAEKPKKEAAAPEISEDDKETVAVLERMEKEWPETYKGRASKYIESVAKAKKYQAEWEAENKGKSFDPDSDEHDEFFKANEVDWNDVHFNKAIAKIEADKAGEAIVRKDAEKNRAIETENKLLKAAPAITMRRAETAKTLFSALGDDYKAVLNDDGSINGAEIKRLMDEDPLREIAFRAANSAEFFAQEIYKVTNRLVEFDEKNPTHKFIAEFVTDQEAAMLAMPAENQLNASGQRFATAEQYAAMTPARRAYYWRFKDKEISDLYAEIQANAAKKEIAAEEIRAQKVAERRGYKKAEVAQPPEAAAAVPAEKPTPAVEKPASPASGVAPRPAQSSSNAAAKPQSSADSFTARWL